MPLTKDARRVSQRHLMRVIATPGGSNYSESFGGRSTEDVRATSSQPQSWRFPALVARWCRGLNCSARLDEPDYRLAMVAAPAGYGKTATLASWASDQPHDLAWLSCDASDAEPTRFMSGLLATISVQWPGVADDAFVMLERDGSRHARRSGRRRK